MWNKQLFYFFLYDPHKNPLHILSEGGGRGGGSEDKR